MLVLCRNVKERVTIQTPDGQRLEVILVNTRGRTVKLGFEGNPSAFKILRNEIIDKPPGESDGDNALAET